MALGSSISGRETCKKLRGSVQTKEIEDQSDGENDKSSDDIIVIDDDDDDDGEVNDDQDYGDEDKSSDNIIVLDDDDDGDDDGDDGDDDDDINDVQDYNEEGTSSEDIKVLDDDDAEADNDDINDVQNYVEEDSSSEDIIVIDDDQDYGDDDYDDDENERRRGAKIEGKKKGSSGALKKSDNEDDRQYLDNDMNPFFKVRNLHRKTDLRVPGKVIKDFGLHFLEFINLIDPLEKKSGKLKRKVEGQTIKGFVSIIRRNKVKSTDKMVCELEKDMNGLGREIKFHVIRG